MEFNFNNPFTFPQWNGAFIPPGFNNASQLQQHIAARPPVPQPFTTNVVYTGARFPSTGVFPFGLTVPYSCNSQTGNQNNQFSGSWNYGYPHTLNPLMQHNHTANVDHHTHVPVPVSVSAPVRVTPVDAGGPLNASIVNPPVNATCVNQHVPTTVVNPVNCSTVSGTTFNPGRNDNNNVGESSQNRSISEIRNEKMTDITNPQTPSLEEIVKATLKVTRWREVMQSDDDDDDNSDHDCMEVSEKPDRSVG